VKYDMKCCSVSGSPSIRRCTHSKVEGLELHVANCDCTKLGGRYCFYYSHRPLRDLFERLPRRSPRSCVREVVYLDAVW